MPYTPAELNQVASQLAEAAEEAGNLVEIINSVDKMLLQLEKASRP
jgi:hypothetical protein